MCNIVQTKALIFCLCVLFLHSTAQAADHLLYFEAQEIFGYSSALGKTIPYSMYPDVEMQKPSVGFDYVQRFSGESGDVATLALQARLAATQVEQGAGYLAEQRVFKAEQDGYKLQPQVYNAYLKVKTPWTYVWIGHNRPAFGLSSVLDSHGLLLSTLGMRFGYDRDWGVGANKDFSWGDISASETSGTGMPFIGSMAGMPFNSHYMTAARVSYGVLSRDNYSIGYSQTSGKTLQTTGYTLMELVPRPMHMSGTDLTILNNNLEHRFDLLAGEWLGEELHAFFYRFGVNLDQEGRYKLEAQTMYWKFGMERDYRMALCFSVLATSNLTVRTAYVYDGLTDDNRFLMQLYYYMPI